MGDIITSNVPDYLSLSHYLKKGLINKISVCRMNEMIDGEINVCQDSTCRQRTKATKDF